MNIDVTFEKQDKKEIYTFEEKSASAHILHSKQYKIWAYALYDDYQAENKGLLTNVNIHQALPHEHENVAAHPGYALIMQEDEPNQLKLALSFLDLRLQKDYSDSFFAKKKNAEYYGSAPVIVKLKLKGLWALSTKNPDVELTHIENQTQLLIHCNDGLSKNLNLTTSPKKRYMVKKN